MSYCLLQSKRFFFFTKKKKKWVLLKKNLPAYRSKQQNNGFDIQYSDFLLCISKKACFSNISITLINV